MCLYVHVCVYVCVSGYMHSDLTSGVFGGHMLLKEILLLLSEISCSMLTLVSTDFLLWSFHRLQSEMLALKLQQVICL